MFRLYVLQHQWAILGIFSGFALVCAMVLTYMMIWFPRDPRRTSEMTTSEISLIRWYFTFMPWILQMTFLSAVLFGILYVVYTACVPPNW